MYCCPIYPTMLYTELHEYMIQERALPWNPNCFHSYQALGQLYFHCTPDRVVDVLMPPMAVCTKIYLSTSAKESL